MTKIKLLAFALGVGLPEETASPKNNTVARCSSSSAAASFDKGCGAKSSQQEGGLIRLKEQSLTELSWKKIQEEMHTRFMHRTAGSLQCNDC